MARCFVTRRIPGPALDRLIDAHDVEVWPHRLPPTPDELREHVAGVEGLLSLLTDTVDEALLDAAPELRAISNYAVGTDNVDLEAATRRGIPVGNTPDVLTDATADLAFALLLALARRLPEGERDVREGQWVTFEPDRNLGAEVTGATLGIVGFGRIGQAVARRAEGFGMEILHTARSGGTPLEELLERSDFVTLHCPLTPDTRHLIDEAALDRMKPTALLVNTARGPIVDPAALERALHERAIAGAALDVTDPEPLPADHPLLRGAEPARRPPRRLGDRADAPQDDRARRRQPARRARRRADAAPGQLTRVAVVDIGTQLDAAADRRRRAAARSTEVERRSVVTRLGEGVDASGALGEAPRQRVLDVLEQYAEAIAEHGAERTTAVMTSAVRDASNGAEFADAVRTRFGFDARIARAATRRRG